MSDDFIPRNEKIALYRTHFWDDACAREVAKLRKDLPDHDVAIVGVTDEKIDLHIPANTPAFIYTHEEVRKLNYPQQEKLRADHVYLINFFRRHPGYKQYWLIEYDVRYSGNWAHFVDGLASSPADLLGTIIQTQTENPEWSHWVSLATGQQRIPQSSCIKVFGPLMRLSNQALAAIDTAYATGWTGHYEALWGTAIAAAGLTIEEIGGDGSFTPVHRKGRFYSSTRLDPYLSPGTFVFRPSMLEEEIPNWPDTLWHPVKSAAMSQPIPAEEIPDARTTVIEDGPPTKEMERRQVKFIETLYRLVLKRPADVEGLKYWLDILQTTGEYYTVLESLMGSDEYKASKRPAETSDPAMLTGGMAGIPFGSIAGLALDQTDAGLPSGVDIIVPVCNAGRWLEAICDGYENLHLKPLFIVEGRSTDESLSILKRRNARVFTAMGKQPYVESLLSGIIPHLSSRWILRLDDDELPSRGTIQWIAESIDAVSEAAVAIPRYWVHRREDGEWEASALGAVEKLRGFDYQVRLFRPGAVIPADAIHTPGFETIEAYAPQSARFFHLDWIVRNYEERVQKVTRYERLEAGRGQRFSGFYLPEDNAAALYEFKPLDDPDVRAVCERIIRN